MKHLQFLLLFAALISAMTASATVLTFDLINYDPPLCRGNLAFPENYGDRVTFDSYIPPNYTTYADKTWFYGSGGGHTPNIVADYRIRTEPAGMAVAACLVGDLYEVLMGSFASTGEQFIEVTLTADPGYLVHLDSFDLANKVGPRNLPHLKVSNGSGVPLLDATDVPIDGGPAGTHSTFNNSSAGWTAQQLVIRLDAPFDDALYLTDPNEAEARHIHNYGIDNIAFSQVTSLAVSAPPPVSVECPGPPPAAATDLASFVAQGGSVSGQCSASAVVVHVGDAPAGICPEWIERVYRVFDGCGDVVLCTQIITVQDTTAPVFQRCPANQTIITGPGPVTYTAQVTDTCDPAPTVTYDPPSGSIFPMGTTVVTCHATDRCGNHAECYFNVTVNMLGCSPGSQQAYVKASNTGLGDGFGYCLAIDGDTLVVGAPYEKSKATGVDGDQSDDSAASSGAAYVFLRAGGGWVQQAYLKASNTDPQDRFGSSVAISGDTIVVGAPGEASGASGVDGDQSDNSSGGAGAAYVFVRSGGIWSQQAYLKASNTRPTIFQGQSFGGSVAVSGDTIVVGAWGEDGGAVGINGDQSDDSAPDSGAAYVFVRSGTTWSQEAYLKASNTEADDNFGWAVAISGETVAIGAPHEDSKARGVGGDQSDNSAEDSGAAYVFIRSGGIWSQNAYLKSSSPGAHDVFGSAVGVSGNTVVVGAQWEDSDAIGVNGDPNDNSSIDSGAAYVFVQDGTIWSQQAYLKASNTRANARFGYSVGISGNTVVVGAVLEGSNARGLNGNQSDITAPGSGAAYVFVRGGDAWAQQAYLKASNTDVGDEFGASVGVSGDTVLAGATGESSSATGVNGDQLDNSAAASGATYVFLLANGPCTHDDIFAVPGDVVVSIPVIALLANDAHSQGLPLVFAGNDPATALGVIIKPIGLPVTALEIRTIANLPPGATEDTFTYEVTDGTHKATGAVHLRPITWPFPLPDTLTLIPPPADGGGLTIPFNAPAGGTYALERKTLALPGGADGVWTEIARQYPTDPCFITFVDAMLPGHAIYRVRSVP